MRERKKDGRKEKRMKEIKMEKKDDILSQKFSGIKEWNNWKISSLEISSLLQLFQSFTSNSTSN